MTEEQEKHMENFNPTEKRTSLFSHLDYAISLSREKSSKEKAKNTERMSWTRILICAVEAYGKLLDSVELENLETRLEKLEMAAQPETLSALNLPTEPILNRLRREREESEREESEKRDTDTSQPPSEETHPT